MDRKMALAELYAELESLAGSLPLASFATDIIPGEGSPDASVLLIGEAPGLHEQQQRRPFVGRSGQLLRKVLTELELPPESLYISNIVKARPPENRDPFPEEIKAYKPFLDREILILEPKLIVTLGRFSMAKFLPEVKISQVHGRLHKVQWFENNLFVLPMYHPAAALRSTKTKESFISDFQKVPKILAWIESQQQNEAFAAAVEEVLL